MSLADSYESCSCDFDGEPITFESTAMRKSRKTHMCTECGCSIERGDKYEHVVLGCDGGVYVFKTCPLCIELRSWAKISVPCFCYSYGDVIERVRLLVDEARDDMPKGWMFEWGRRMVPIRARQRGVQ